MPKIYCRCDNVVDLTTIPSPSGYALVSEQTIDSLYGSPSNSQDEVLSKLRRLAFQAYRCDRCGRLIVFWEKAKNEPTFYMPEAAG